MAKTTITVRGEYSAYYPAERATVRASVHVDGPRRDPAFSTAVEASQAVRSTIEALFDKERGPITWWTSDSVRVWSSRPWNAEGKQLPLVFHAGVDFSAKFSDFDALAKWVESAAATDHVNLGAIEWTLTEATRTAATTEVRSRAVKDAVTKATVFAQAIGLSSVSAVALADPGMLGDPSNSPSQFEVNSDMMMVSSGGGSELAFKPEEIAVASVVDARFVAS